MEAIKKAKHYKLAEIAKECICNEEFNGVLQPCIVCKEMELQKLYERYKLLLSQLDLTIKEYNLLQRRFEVDLRKLQIKERKRINSDKMSIK